MKRILIAAFDGTGNEPEALRQVLEQFGYLVLTKYIGRPNDLIAVLGGAVPFDADIIVLSCHGEEGQILMPVLGASAYAAGEPKGNFSAQEIGQYLNLTGKVILNTGCTTGAYELAGQFGKENIYLAPADYIEGNDALLFAMNFFYHLTQQGHTPQDAYRLAKASAGGTEQFLCIGP